jgi:hypothetical protein
VIESDGKTENAQRTLALDPLTLAALKLRVEKLDQERAALGPDYEDHGLLFCWETGEPPHPDTIMHRFHRFHRLAEAAGLPLINLYDVRHSYATAGRDAKIDWKALSTRIGHADVAFTMRQYVQTDVAADRQVSNALAELIIGGSLASVELAGEVKDQDGVRRPSHPSRAVSPSLADAGIRQPFVSAELPHLPRLGLFLHVALQIRLRTEAVTCA